MVKVFWEGKKIPCISDPMNETERMIIEYTKNLFGLLATRSRNFCPVCFIKEFILIRIFSLIGEFLIINDAPVLEQKTVRIVWASDDVFKETFSNKLPGNDR